MVDWPGDQRRAFFFSRGDAGRAGSGEGFIPKVNTIEIF
jgi:hypothetical protein